MKHFEKLAALLEFDRIREGAAACALCGESAEIIKKDPPLFDPGQIRTRKEQVSAFCGLLKNGEEPKQELPSAAFLFPRLAVEGAVLDAGEALALGLFIERGEALRGFALGGEGGLRQTAQEAPDCSAAAAEVFRVIGRDGNIRDLPEIKRIRSRIQELSKDLERLAGRYAADEDKRRMLQSGLPSQRDGRLVLAVKANFRGRIKGIVHEVSATGQTVFVEPEESVEKNNQILEEKAALDAEIRRLLRALTKTLGERREDIEAFHRVILELDCIRARARYSLETGGVFALESAGEIFLKAARHPLLGKSAVPIGLRLDPPVRTAIITGPNTGGKTVTLKTAGLYALMNQAGLALPAAEVRLPFFDGIYADIGDEQSLSQSLSTFSAHMTNISAIIGGASERSLVLLDELGSGTDPEEGCAIAMAVLDHFIETKTTTLVTTHHGVLKNYGYGREGVENASVEFDSRTLSPTYRIIMGIPGESRALDIARRNGFPPELADRAASYLEGERSDISALIAGLKTKHRELDEAARSAREEQNRLREERRRADLKELSLRQKEFFLKQKGADEFRSFLGESRKKLENLVREIREGELDREKTLKVKEFLKGLEASSAAMEKALEAEAAALSSCSSGGKKSPEEQIIPGMEVFAGPARRRGRVIREDKGGWIVETGSVRMSFPGEQLAPAQPGPEKTGPGWAAELVPGELKPELKLLGMRLDEALEALRRQTDAAVLAGLSGFAVIHGKGDGVLQKGVRDYLEQEPAVEDYFFSRPELGGFGRTEVVLKK